MNDEVQPEGDAAEAPKTDEPKTRKRKAKAAAPKKKKSAKKVVDPLGDAMDGEGQFATGADEEAPRVTEFAAEQVRTASETDVKAAVQTEAEPMQAEGREVEDPEAIEEAESRPAPKLERLQKILAQAGVASRRHAEELITQGRVQVNGQVVTVLGSKADRERDHIRVDGKLLHGAERLRYFVLNKPRGYVTTVSDPEGRPTVMEFFSKLGERLYPVGRLDFQSEGLLLVTNDGALANQLTRAASGVEKTYLVKVSGKPDEGRLQALREGIPIERGRPGEGKVRTAPARIRQIRPGENPWYEVVLIEGRNRELRKMFEEIGHHVEKIRRVGYGPLALDVPPGEMRELDHKELEALRQTAEGKLKPRRVNAGHMLPKEAGIPAEQRESTRGKQQFRKERFQPKEGPAQRREFGGRREGGFQKRGARREGGFPIRGGKGTQYEARGEGGFANRGERRGGNREGRAPDRAGREAGRFDNRGERPERGFRERTGGAGGFRRGAGRVQQGGGRREAGFRERTGGAGGFSRERGGGRPNRFRGEKGSPEPRREGKRLPERGAEGGGPERRKPFTRARGERPEEGRFRLEREESNAQPRGGRESRPGFKGGQERGAKRFERGGGAPRGGKFGGKGRGPGGQHSRPYSGKGAGGRPTGKGRKRF